MSDKKANRGIWDALAKTDPRYTKPVTFGRKFTSINSQWQLMRMTEQFGPIGVGWGYNVVHGIERISELYVLAVADVTIWWNGEAERGTAAYGPVRGMAPLIEPARDKGRMLYEDAEKTLIKLHLDDDAGKKAMTDALTKGLSHIGLSADVFLGQFDDVKYVREVAQEFADAEHPLPPEDRALMTNGADDTRSQYEVDKIKRVIENDWKVVNKTPKGQEDQIFAYLNLARNPDDAAKISANNADLIAAAPWAAEFAEELDKLLRYFEKAAAPLLQ